MTDFSFTLPLDVEFGVGILRRLPELVRRYASERVLLVSDPGLEAVGLVQKVKDILTGGGIACETFTKVVPNPGSINVTECVAAYRAFEATGFVALGGGSAIDTAKAAAIIAKFGGEIAAYEGGGTVPGRIDPLIAIPTTSGTGSEVSSFTVIVDESRNYKLTINDPKIYPKCALLDPEMIMTLPPHIAAACGMDALIHALESFINNTTNLFAEAVAEKAMRLIGRNIRRYVACRTDEEAACAMMMGASFAGMSMITRLGEVHAMSHPVSAFFGVAHGVANAVLLPTILAWNALGDKYGRYAQIYEYITGKRAGEDFDPQTLVDVIQKLNDDLGIPRGLAAMGVTADKIPVMAADAMKSGNILVNPRTATQKDIEMLYHRAM